MDSMKVFSFFFLFYFVKLAASQGFFDFPDGNKPENRNPQNPNSPGNRNRDRIPDLFGRGGTTEEPANKVGNGNLTCYVCSLDFRQGYKRLHPCLGRYGISLDDDYLTRCGVKDIYCRVERTEVNGMLIYLSRQCIDQCYYGCRPKGFGISFEACSDCCDTDACNDFYPPLSKTQMNNSNNKLILLTILSIIFRLSRK